MKNIMFVPNDRKKICLAKFLLSILKDEETLRCQFCKIANVFN